MWGRRAYLRRDAGSFTDLFDIAALDDLLNTTARRPTFRMVRDGAPVPHGEVTTRVRLGGVTVDDVADVSRIGDRLTSGDTLVVQGLQRTWPPLVDFCRSLERAISHVVQANAYLTPAGAAGLAEHHDTHDVFVVQLEGTKAWDVEGLGTIVLRPGDVLYMPTGTRHRAEAQDAFSLHLTIGLLTDTYRAVIGRLLADEALLDAALPIGWARGERGAELIAGIEAAIDTAAARLRAVSAEEISAAETARARGRRRPLLRGHLPSVLAPIGDTTVVRRRADNPAVVALDDDALRVDLVDRTLRMPVFVWEAVTKLVGRDEISVGDLPGLDEPGRAVLVRRLVREGLLEVVR